MFGKFHAFFRRAGQRFVASTAVETIKRSLVSLIPVLLIGAFSLTARYFPIPIYQTFLESAPGAFWGKLLDSVYGVTFGLLSLYMCVSIGYHYSDIRMERGQGATIACALVSVACFAILTNVTSLNTETLGPKGMFLSIVASLGASALFCRWVSPLNANMLLADGADVNLNNALRLIFPMMWTVAVFALGNELILLVSGGQSVHELLLQSVNSLFSLVGGGFAGGLLFVFLSSLLWFFGIHGSDVLEGVAASFFVPNIDLNIAQAAAGQAPTQIFTKQFFDVFVLMGGCGSAICLLIALFLFGKRKSNRGLAKMALVPMLFNINEIMVFGLPIIYNPVMLVPFLCVPVLCFLSTYAAMSLGLVPLITAGVEWTTPVILGGYIATGSLRGSLLQIFNMALGVLVYRPFVIRYDAERSEHAKRDYEHLVEAFKLRELRREEYALTERPGPDGALAKSLAAEIRYAIDAGNLEVHYQPQYTLSGACFGAEALLRLRMPELGTLYPPLVIELAREIGKLADLEKYVFSQVRRDARVLWEATGLPLKLSVNISGQSIQSRDFEQFLLELVKDRQTGIQPCIEITEQTALIFDEELKSRISRLKEAGYLFAIDDFSAGSTSLQYLQEKFFDLVKLDGSIVQNCLSSERSYELTTTIIGLSHSLGFQVLAEYVSSREIRDCMARAGCNTYQGWLYAPALEFESFLQRLLAEQEG